MSKERARAREAREAARAAAVKVELEKAARARARTERRAKLVPAVPVRRRRQERFGALPRRTAAALLAGWCALQVLLWQFFAATGTRLSLAVLSGALLLMMIKTRRPHR